VEHVKENAGALDITLTAQDLLKLERAFPAPAHKTPLDVV
jgi:aryl-alcohol dehydrogenase-like predicted oxidoreductase